MKKSIIYGCILAATTFTLQSCSDFLQEDPKGRQSLNKYFSTQSELDMAVYALYEQVNHTQNYTNPMYPQWQGDDITANPGSNKQACAEIDKFSVSDNNKGIVDAWRLHYSVIKAANFIIDNAERTPVRQENINQALGQAKFWRAYAYFYLVRVFGPIPLNPHNENDKGKTPLTDIQGVYDIILRDLEDCEGYNLPAKYTKAPESLFNVNVYVTQQAVKSTLAAVYMAMAGYPLNKGMEYYAKAATKAKEVIDGVNNGSYDIIINTEWKDVYSYGNNYNKETILGINYSPTKNWFTDSELSSCVLFESLGGWGDSWGEIKFWKEFPEGPRKTAVYDPQIRLKDGTLTDWWALNSDGTAVIPERHPMFSIFTINADNKGNEIREPYDYTKPPYTGMCTDTRHQLIRYTEVLLWYAESAARSGGDLNLAKQCLKKVRERAVEANQVGIVGGINIDQMNADQLAEAAWKEHGWEIAGYWVAMVTRRGDELRLNKLKENFEYRKTNAPITVATGFTATESVPVQGTWNDNLNYMPYPGIEVGKNPNLKR